VVVKLPLPPGNMLGIWENEARFKAGYFSKFDLLYYLAMVVIKMKTDIFSSPEERMT
jgi:acyl-coenzyme A synthetase/AMP-(fatty) acid ligase